MSRPRFMRPMAPELAALGDQLEAAMHLDVRRRRARRQVVWNAAASLLIAIPVAISIATATIGGREDFPVGAAGASAMLHWTPGFDLSFRHIPDKPIITLEWARCLDARDCRVVSEPVPFAVDFPPRRA